VDKLREADTIVDALGKAMINGNAGLSNVPGLLLRVIREDLWRKRIVIQTGQVAEFKTFIEFVTTAPLEGLGADLPLLRRLCGDNTEVRTELDRVTRQGRGAPEGNKNAAKHKEPETNGLNQPICLRRDRADRDLRRLEKDYPDLHEQVVRDGRAVYDAAIEAGFYPKRIAVNLRNAQSAARTLLNNASPEFIEELIAYLTTEVD